MRRGELRTVAGGVYASKPRPALILQDDLFDGIDSIVVLPCTTNRSDSRVLRVRIPADDVSGLSRDSDVMVEKITSVRRTAVGERVGRLTADQLAAVERSVMVFLGFAR